MNVLVGYRHVQTSIRVRAGGAISSEADQWCVDDDELEKKSNSLNPFLKNVVDERQVNERLLLLRPSIMRDIYIEF